MKVKIEAFFACETINITSCNIGIKKAKKSAEKRLKLYKKLLQKSKKRKIEVFSKDSEIFVLRSEKKKAVNL